MNGQLNGALKSAELDGHKDASVIRKRKPSSDKSAFSAVFSTAARYDPFSSSPSSSYLSPFQPIRLPEPISNPKLPTGSTAAMPTMNIVGDLDGRIQLLQVLSIPDSFGDTMAPLNVSKLFENKLRPPDVSKIMTEKLALADLSRDFGAHLVSKNSHNPFDHSKLSARISEILRLPKSLSIAIVERLPSAVTKILTRERLPPSKPKPHTTPFDVQKLFLKDALPTANVAKLFENGPAKWLKARPDPIRFWQLIGQTGQLIGRRTPWLYLPRLLLTLILPIFPIGGAIYLSLNFLVMWARFASTIAGVLLTVTKLRKAYELIASAMNVIDIAIELWQVYGLNASLKLLFLQCHGTNINFAGYSSGIQFSRPSSDARHYPQIPATTLHEYASRICN